MNLLIPLRRAPTSAHRVTTVATIVIATATTAQITTVQITTAQITTVPATTVPATTVQITTAKEGTAKARVPLAVRGSSIAPMALAMTMTEVNVNAVVGATVLETIAIHVPLAANLGIPNQRFLKTMSCCQ